MTFAGEEAAFEDFVSAVFPVAENVEPLEIANDLLLLPGVKVFSFCALTGNENAINARRATTVVRGVGIDLTHVARAIAGTVCRNFGLGFAVYLQVRNA